ncbi:3-hydroxybutyrate dehydrogenase [Sphingobacterium sp. SYP-B4668]|uniref:3-hydroxybutyrate dehydrogenase n=1 Tax=Sphingobacterium sp. SYP-B4668 TaxID=2996035 RepID=UPI0022DE82F5|nr:3-hydroxybutyrate dehydrogenase [Sphingobacterium sp. SYP-B4668]
MKDRVAIVTGAASGIGLEVAKRLASVGAEVYLLDRDARQVSLHAQMLVEQGFSAIGIECDITDESSLERVFQEIVVDTGRIDILINNAGRQFVAAIDQFPSHEFESMIKLMLVAPFFAIKHVFPVMKQRGYGRIVNMASVNGVIGFAGKAAYNSAKHGVIGLTKVAALEGAAYGITVNAVCPGYVDTPLLRNQLADLGRAHKVAVDRVLEDILLPLIPQRRLLDVSEVADYTLYLLGEQAKGITGQSVIIDGGYTVQ